MMNIRPQTQCKAMIFLLTRDLSIVAETLWNWLGVVGQIWSKRRRRN